MSDGIYRREQKVVEYNRTYRGMFAERNDDFGCFGRPKRYPCEHKSTSIDRFALAVVATLVTWRYDWARDRGTVQYAPRCLIRAKFPADIGRPR